MGKYFGAAGLAVVIFLVFGAIPGAFLWPYTLNTWLHFLNKPESVVWWHGVIIGFIPVLGQFTIPAAIVTWILMLFIA